MKRCPECDEVYEDATRFCDVDGSPLVPDTTPPDESAFLKTARAEYRERRAGSGDNSWMVGLVGALVGITVCLLAFAVYHASGGRTEDPAPTRPSATPESLSGVRRAPETRPVEEGVTPTPSPEPSPEPSPTPPPLPAPTAVATSPLDSLSDAPVSTGGQKAGADGPRITVRLHNGTSIEVDDVWRSSVGVWYRRGTVVSQLDPESIKSIERRTPAPPAPAESPTPQ